MATSELFFLINVATWGPQKKKGPLYHEHLHFLCFVFSQKQKPLTVCEVCELV
jgi:hypothetical protein